MAATAEFQKILDQPGIVFNHIIGPLVHLGLGRARALSGDQSGARRAWEGFCALWPGADPGIPALRKPQAEYGRLQ